MRIQRDHQLLTKKVDRLQRQLDDLAYVRKAQKDTDDIFARRIKDRATYRRIRKMVDAYAQVTGRGRTDIWGWLYEEYGRQYELSVHFLRKDPNVSKLELIEQEGRLVEFCYMVSELCDVEL